MSIDLNFDGWNKQVDLLDIQAVSSTSSSAEDASAKYEIRKQKIQAAIVSAKALRSLSIYIYFIVSIHLNNGREKDLIFQVTVQLLAESCTWLVEFRCSLD